MKSITGLFLEVGETLSFPTVMMLDLAPTPMLYTSDPDPNAYMYTPLFALPSSQISLPLSIHRS